MPLASVVMRMRVSSWENEAPKIDVVSKNVLAS
jgi:hypothetical protein